MVTTDNVNARPYLVPLNDEFEHEIIVNRSRFICVVQHCCSNDEAKRFVQIQRERFPDASHHCYAFVTGAPHDSQSYGFSDDGEPSGTAGKPMLMAVQGSGIGEVCTIVIRYFGGVKLGTGGLQRAYGGSVREALALLPSQLKTPQITLQLNCPYDQLKDVEHAIESVEGTITEQQFSDVVELNISLPIPEKNNLQQKLTNLSGGLLTLIEDS